MCYSKNRFNLFNLCFILQVDEYPEYSYLKLSLKFPFSNIILSTYPKFSLKRSAILQGNLFSLQLFFNPLNARYASVPSTARNEAPIR